MKRNIPVKRNIVVSALATCALLLGVGLADAQVGATAPEARAMLEKAIAALKADKADALAKFPRMDSGFRDRDLYVFCFNTSDGKFTAHVSSALMGKDVRTLKAGTDPLGQRMLDTVKGIPEESIRTVDYEFPKPGTTVPVPKQSYLTRIGDQGCGVGYYK